MIYRNIPLPVFFCIERGTIENLIEIIKGENFYFNTVAILTGNFGENIIETYEIKKQFSKCTIINVYKYCSLSKIRSAVIREKSDLILSIGGGYVNDIGKYISMETSIPLITIPTILSNDGIASPISIIRLNGKYKSIGTTFPLAVIGDVEILEKSPEIYFLSGVGDLFSNFSAIYDWELANKETGEKIDIIPKNISYSAAINIFYNILSGNYDTIKDEKFIKDLFNSLVMSAISMIIAKSSRPASGAEHNISHAIDKFLPEKKVLHGLQVGYFTLFSIYLHKKFDNFLKLKNIFRDLNYNIKFNYEDVTKILYLAKKIRKRYTILNKYSNIDLNEKYKNFLKDLQC